VVLDPVTAQSLVAPLGLDLSPLLGADAPGTKWERSPARDLGVSAHIEVPLAAETVRVPSLVAEVPDIPDETGRVVVFAARNFGRDEIEPARADVLAALARLMSARRAPFVFVDFDASADSRAVRESFKDRRVALVLVLDDLHSGALRFKTANGELIPAFDLYAQKAGAQYDVTRQTAGSGEYLEPFPGVKTMVIGSDGGDGDARADAAAVIAYLAARGALGAPEVPR
jgi:hypothetical protein